MHADRFVDGGLLVITEVDVTKIVIQVLARHVHVVHQIQELWIDLGVFDPRGHLGRNF